MTYPTEEETQYQRRVIREAYPTLFDALEGQLRYVDEHLSMIPTAEATPYGLALSAHLARASKTTMGILTLCEYGYGELAQSALRSLGEAMVSAYYMSLDPETRAERFQAYSQLEAIKAYRFAQEMGWERELGDVPDHFRDEEWIARVEADFPRPVDGWMQERMNRVIDDIAPCWQEHGEREFRRIAKVLHFFGDRHSHIGAHDTIDFLRVNEEGHLVLHLGPGKKWVAQSLTLAAWVYGQAFDLWAEHFELPDLESWRRRWRLLYARCKTLEPEEVEGVGRNAPCPCGSGFKYKRCHADLMS